MIASFHACIKPDAAFLSTKDASSTGYILTFQSPYLFLHLLSLPHRLFRSFILPFPAFALKHNLPFSFLSASLFFALFFHHLALKGLRGVRRSPLHGNAVSHSFTHTHFLTVSHLMMLPYPELHRCTLPRYVLRSPSLSLLVSRRYTHSPSPPPVCCSSANAASSTACEMFNPSSKGNAGESR